MNHEAFTELFPNANLVNQKTESTNELSLNIDGQWYVIPKETLTEREQVLINYLTQTQKERSDSKWARYLFNKDSKPACTADYIRLIQLKLSAPKKDIDLTYWYEAISHLFTGVLDIFFKEEDHCYVVQRFSADSLLSIKEFSNLLQTVEDDYAIKITAYVGYYWSTSHEINRLWLEEIDLFQSQVHYIFKPVVSLAHLALPYYTDKGRHHSLILHTLYKYIKEQPEWLEMIHALWANQRNLTEAAKALYLHRNTLQYRMTKFEDQTHLSLKETDDLALAYLITLTK